MPAHLPNGLVIGPQKAGTSWLQEYFKECSNVTLPKGVKETFFFDRYHVKGLDWYHSHFQDTVPGALIIEVAPTYFEDAEVPQRIHDALGRIPIICTLRDPADRTFSLYQHMCRYGLTKLPFREAVEELGIIRGSLYAENLERWRNIFGEDQVKVMFVEDLATDPETYVAEIASFLDIALSPVPDRLRGRHYEAATSPNYYLAKATSLTAQFLRSMRLYSAVNYLRDTPLKTLIFGKPNPRVPQEKITPEDRQWLLDRWLLSDLDALEKMLGQSFERWKH